MKTCFLLSIRLPTLSCLTVCRTLLNPHVCALLVLLAGRCAAFHLSLSRWSRAHSARFHRSLDSGMQRIALRAACRECQCAPCASHGILMLVCSRCCCQVDARFNLSASRWSKGAIGTVTSPSSQWYAAHCLVRSVPRVSVRALRRDRIVLKALPLGLISRRMLRAM